MGLSDCCSFLDLLHRCSLRELRVQCTLTCFVCLHMAHGVNIRVRNLIKFILNLSFSYLDVTFLRRSFYLIFNYLFLIKRQPNTFFIKCAAVRNVSMILNKAFHNSQATLAGFRD